MEKIWYIFIDGKKEGPYDLHDLKHHPKLTPDTLAWKPGFREWVPIRSIFELLEIFKDEGEKIEEEEQKEIKSAGSKVDDDAVALRYEPPLSYFWIFIAFLM